MNDNRLREIVAQMVMPALSVAQYIRDPAYKKQIQSWVAKDSIGGFIIFDGTRETVIQTTRELQSLSEIPLFFSCDIEPGLTPRVADATSFPHAMAIGRTTPELCKQAAAAIAEEALAVGININFAPVCDVNNNPKNPIINIRSFGETAEQVARYSNAFIHGTQSRGVLAVAKHFPGHGDTEKDSHLELPSLSIPRKRFDDLEFIPFLDAIKNNVGGIMAAHIIATAFDEKNPATLSRHIITDILRGELGYQGLVFTDALIMHAITKNYSVGDAAKFSTLAGCDILLMPENVDQTLAALLDSAKNDPSTLHSIERSFERITEAKKKVSSGNQVPPAPDFSANNALAEKIASQAISIAGNQSIFDRKHENIAFVLIGAEKEAENMQYAANTIMANADKHYLKVKLHINPQTVHQNKIDCVILMIFNGVYSFQGDLGDKNMFLHQAELALHSGTEDVIGVSLGSPYICNELPNFPVTVNCFSNSRVSIRTSVVRILDKLRGT